MVAHSEKELAAPTFKKTFGHHPVLAFLDHDEGGTGEALAGLLRRGNANANNAADLVATMDAALAALPATLQRRALIRVDGGGYSHAFERPPLSGAAWLPCAATRNDRERFRQCPASTFFRTAMMTAHTSTKSE